MESTGHLLSLKVMRVSRPGLASSWQPFFTSSASFSAHATDSLLSLQGKDPLPGNPKTLRDLTHSSQLLTLPSSFGAIQLGETFTSCLCVNNEATVEVEGVSLRIEMQTATNKVLLAQAGGPDQRLGVADVLESVVSHEMKELGQHVLACYVTYRLPPSIRAPQGEADETADPSVQTFRKYYKFAVTNPLNVKTKVHVPRSPTALLSRSEREKIFLEIHIQNMTQEPMWFERMRFECVDGWDVIDGNISHLDGNSLFSSAIATLQPQDVRQHVYILTPRFIPSFPLNQVPGTIIPLGRLDLSWRSSFGEPGRLLTSLLTRRIPIPPSQTAPSAIPPHLQNSRSHSPQPTLSRPTTPPGSPVPFKPRPPSQQVGRPQSPASVVPPVPALPTLPDVEVDLVVRSLSHSEIELELPFNVTFELTLSGQLPPPGKIRILRLVVQHLQPSRVPSLPRASTPTLPATISPRSSLDVSVPRPYVPRASRRDSEITEIVSPTMSPRRGNLNFGLGFSQALNESSSSNKETVYPSNMEHCLSPSSGELSRAADVRLPPPFSSSIKSQSVLPLGASVLPLPPFRLSQPPPSTPVPGTIEPEINSKGEVMQSFECTFVPIRKGFVNMGGLRVILIDDREMEEGDKIDDLKLTPHLHVEAKILREWDSFGEIWVTD